MIVENAKQHMATAVKMETQFPYVLVKPLMVSSAPAEDDKRCQRTDHDRVREYLKDPEKSLFYRFSGVCTGMCDGTGTKTCLIGKNTSGNTFFHTHEKASYYAACHRCRIKCSSDDSAENTRNIFPVDDNYTDGKNNIKQCHKRHQLLGNTSNPPSRIIATRIARMIPITRFTVEVLSAAITL